MHKGYLGLYQSSWDDDGAQTLRSAFPDWPGSAVHPSGENLEKCLGPGVGETSFNVSYSLNSLKGVI